MLAAGAVRRAAGQMNAVRLLRFGIRMLYLTELLRIFVSHAYLTYKALDTRRLGK